METALIESELQKIEQQLPGTVRSWRVETGPDAGGDEAVWVWATVDDEKLSDDTRSRLRDLVRDAVRQVGAVWVYVRFRGTSEDENRS